MRSVLALATLAVLLCVGTAVAHEGEGESDADRVAAAAGAEADTEAEVELEAETESAAEMEAETDAEHPTLPALGSPCLPRVYKRHGVWRVAHPRVHRGLCKAEPSCPPALSVPGHCAGIGVVCCKTAAMEVLPKRKWVEADVVTRKRHHKTHHRHHHTQHHKEHHKQQHHKEQHTQHHSQHHKQQHHVAAAQHHHKTAPHHKQHHHKKTAHHHHRTQQLHHKKQLNRHHRTHHSGAHQQHHNTPAVVAKPTSKPVVAKPVVAKPVVAAPAVVAKPPTPVLKSGLTLCQSHGGVCKEASACSGTTQSGMCPGASTVKCCFAKSVTPPPLKPPTTPVTPPAKPVTPPAKPVAPVTPVNPTSPLPAGTPLNTLMRIPIASINKGVTLAGASFLISKIGKPGCALTPACFACNCPVTNALIKRLTVTSQITPHIRITGLKPYVDAVARAFAALKVAGATNPELMNVYNSAKTAGGLCCRPIKHADGSAGSSWSNHSWGCAADFYFGNTIDPRGDGKCQYGLYLLSPFMAAEKLYWAAGYKGAEEDSMHFETSQESLNAWIAQGLLR